MEWVEIMFIYTRVKLGHQNKQGTKRTKIHLEEKIDIISSHVEVCRGRIWLTDLAGWWVCFLFKIGIKKLSMSV